MARLPYSSSLPYGPNTLVSRILAREPSGWMGAGSLIALALSHASREQADEESGEKEGGEDQKERQLLYHVEHQHADIEMVHLTSFHLYRRPSPKLVERSARPCERVRARIPLLEP